MEVKTKKMSAPVIFISYAREDERTARHVFADLSRAGFSPWFDREHLEPGSQWDVEFPKAIKSSDVFLALMSSKSLNKNGYVQREIKLALAVLEAKVIGGQIAHDVGEPGLVLEFEEMETGKGDGTFAGVHLP
jgi:TIR domain-containing protein